MQDELLGMTAMVSGGGSGIGQAVSLALARAGAAVSVLSREVAEADEVAAQIKADGGKSLAIGGPIEAERTAIRAVEATVAAFGAIDILVCCAGIQRYGDVAATTPDTFDEVFAVNVRGAYLLSHHAIHEIRKKRGSITLVSSVQASATQSDVVAYTASKGALVSMARAMAVDEGQWGVRVNSVSPGSVDTPMLRRSAAEQANDDSTDTDAVLEFWGSAHALGRVASADEVANVVVFLASSRASFVTGSDIRVDGGLTARLAAPLQNPTASKAP